MRLVNVLVVLSGTLVVFILIAAACAVLAEPPTPQPQTTAGKVEVHLIRQGCGTFLCPVQIGKTTEWFLIDTGSSKVCVPQEMATFLEEEHECEVLDDVIRCCMADGSYSTFRKAVIHHFSVGGRQVGTVNSNVIPDGADPLIGQCALEKLAPWRLDYQRAALILE